MPLIVDPAFRSAAGRNGPLVRYFTSNTALIPTPCVEKYSKAVDFRLKPLLPKAFRRSLAHLRRRSVAAWAEFEQHKDATLDNTNGVTASTRAYERNLQAQEEELKEAHRLLGMVMAKHWPGSLYLKGLRDVLGEARARLSLQLVLLTRRRGVMLEGLAVARHLDVDTWLAVMLGSPEDADQVGSGLLMRRCTSWWLQHGRFFHGGGYDRISGQRVPIPQDDWCPIARKWHYNGPRDVGAPIIPTAIGHNVLEKLLGLAFSDITHIYNCLPMIDEFVKAWRHNVFMILPEQFEGGDPGRKYKTILLDEALRGRACFATLVGSPSPMHSTWGDLDERQLIFLSENRPSETFFYVRYLMQMLWCSQQGGYDHLFREGRLWIPEHAMLSRRFVKALIKHVGDHRFAKLFIGELIEAPADSSAAALDAAVREFVQASRIDGFYDGVLRCADDSDSDDYMVVVAQ